MSELPEEKNKYFFDFGNDTPLSLELCPDQTFSMISQLDEFKDKDYLFFYDDKQINNESNISEYKQAQSEETPIRIKIKFSIPVISKDSKKEFAHLNQAFYLNQKVEDVLKAFTTINSIERKKLQINDTKLENGTKLSDIEYTKGDHLLIIITPPKYTIKIKETEETFSLELNDKSKIIDAIPIIKKELEIDYDFEVCKGSAFGNNAVDENREICDVFSESDQIIIEKANPMFTIKIKDKSINKRLEPEYTVKDLLELFKSEFESEESNDDQLLSKLVAINEGVELDKVQLISKITNRQITIKLMEPVYTFKFKEYEPAKISIPDNTDYEEAKNIIKENFDELKSIDDELINFKLNDEEIGDDFIFGPDVNSNEPIIIEILDPSYGFTIYESMEDKTGKLEDFSFPTKFTVGDAINQIEDRLENRYSISIREKRGKIKVDKSVNLYRKYYHQFNKLCIIKRDVKYTFTANEVPFKKRFKMTDKIGQIANFLIYNSKKNKFIFSKEEQPRHISECSIKFVYKEEEYSYNDEFSQLNYNPHEEDKITISLLSPTFPIYSLEQVTKLECKEELKIDDIKKKIKNFEHFILYNNFEPLSGDDEEISADAESNLLIDCFSCEKKIDFKSKKKKFFIYINDENISVDEIKILAAAEISDDENRIHGPGRIKLKYKNTEIGKILFRDIGYKEGEFINISLMPKKFRVKFDGAESDEFELDDDQTVSDLQNKIDDEKAYTLKFKGKVLKDDQKLSDLHISKEDYIDAELTEQRILEIEGKSIILDDYDLSDSKELKKIFQDQIGIDVSNSKFTYKGENFDLNQFESLPKGAKVEVKIIDKSKKFKNFIKADYNNKFFPYKTLREVRKSIYESNPDVPITFLSDGKILPDTKKLFQIEKKIEIVEMKQNCYKKTLTIHKELIKKAKKDKIVTEYFNTQTTGDELKAYIGNIIPDVPIKLAFEDNEIEDDDKICQFGEKIDVISPSESYSLEPEQICFSIKGKLVLSEYSERKTLFNYKKNLKLNEDDEYVFFVNGKLLSENDNLSFIKDQDKEDLVISAYQLNCDDDLFKSATSAERFLKPQLKLDKIIIQEVNNDDEKLEIKYKNEPLTIGGLKDKLSKKLEVKSNKLSLFTWFVDKTENYALLDDDEDVPTVLNLSPEKILYYMIINGSSSLSANMLKNLRGYAKKLKLTDDQVRQMYTKVGGDHDLYYQAIDYRISHMK